MSRIENILCVIDPTATSQPALQRAAWFAAQTGAKLELLICHYNEFLSAHWFLDPGPLKRARAAMIEHHRERLEKLAEPHRAAGLEIKTAAVWDHPLHGGIVRYACSSGVDIVFKDTHQHTGLGLTGLTNTDWSLIRTCPVPLWLVKPHDYPEQPQLIAAIDPVHEHDKPAALDDEIIQISKIIAEAAGGDIHVFHSIDMAGANRSSMMGPSESAYIPTADLEEQIRAHHQLRFKEILELHGLAEDRAHLVDGHTHEVLPQLASKLDAALVVMGAVARNRLQRIFIGSTAERTLDRLSCDLLIIKPSWFKTPVSLETEA